MSVLLDASRLVPIIKRIDPAKAPALFAEVALLNLTPYEVGNALWTESQRLRRLGEAEANRLAQLFNQLWPNITQFALDQIIFAEAWTKALKHGISFYDASYIEAARAYGVQLITDDAELRRVAAQYVNVSSSEDFLKSHLR